MRRRALAAALDLLGLLMVFAAWVAARVWRSRHRIRDRASDRPDSASRLPRWVQLARSRSGQRVLWLVGLAFVGIPLRNGRSPGMRAAGIQMVDARSGGPVSIRSAVIGAAVDVAWRQLISRLTSPLKARSEDVGRREALEPQLTQLLAPHAGDHAAQTRIRDEFYTANGIRSIGESHDLWRVMAALLMPLTALISPRRQTLRERLAGTLVIRTRERSAVDTPTGTERTDRGRPRSGTQLHPARSQRRGPVPDLLGREDRGHLDGAPRS